jgi:hypothetical protein
MCIVSNAAVSGADDFLVDLGRSRCFSSPPDPTNVPDFQAQESGTAREEKSERDPRPRDQRWPAAVSNISHAIVPNVDLDFGLGDRALGNKHRRFELELLDKFRGARLLVAVEDVRLRCGIA